jgi:hypothetical protein
MSRFVILCAAAIAAIGSAGLSAAADMPKAAEARIPFVNHRGIYDWQAIDRTTLYVQDAHKHWYRATLIGDCTDLPFAQTIGFDTGPDDTLDRFSSIIVRGQRCPLTSLVASEAPPKKAKKH